MTEEEELQLIHQYYDSHPEEMGPGIGEGCDYDTVSFVTIEGVGSIDLSNKPARLSGNLPGSPFRAKFGEDLTITFSLAAAIGMVGYLDTMPPYRIYGANGKVTVGDMVIAKSGPITGASNAAPIVITSAGHGLGTGDMIYVMRADGNEGALGSWNIAKIDDDSFSLEQDGCITLDDNGLPAPASYGSGEFTGNGEWQIIGVYKLTVSITAIAGFERGKNYQLVIMLPCSGTAMVFMGTIMVE